MPYVDGQWVNPKRTPEEAAEIKALGDAKVRATATNVRSAPTDIRGGAVAAPAPQQQAAPERPALDIAGLLGGIKAPSFGGSGSAPQSWGTEFTSTVQDDPRLTGWADAVQKRALNPGESTRHAIDVAGSAIRDASEGRKKALRAGASSRGALGMSNIPQIGEAALGAQEGRDINKAATDISLGREKDADQLLLGAGDAAKAPGQARLQGQQQSVATWQAVQQNQRAQEASALQAYLGQLDVVSKLASLAY